MHEQTPEPRYVTLRDYLRVLRNYRILIVLLAIAGGAAALLRSLGEEEVYEATASIAFQDESRDLSLVGAAGNASRPPAQLAASKAASVTRPDVLKRARAALGPEATTNPLGSNISVSVEPSSALVNVKVSSSEPQFAADAANAVSRAAVEVSNRRTRARFANAAENLRREAENVIKGSPDIGTRVLYVSELSRLDSLSRFARSADLVRPASVPAKAVSPKPVRSTILGLLGGLLLGLLLAFLRDSLDRRLRSAHDIQTQFRLPVLGHVRDDHMGRVAYIETGSNGNSELDLEPFRILRRNLDFLDPGARLRSLVVSSALPEEGKTTVSGSLAFVMAVAGKTTLLVECDLRRPMLAARLGIDPSPGLSDYLAGEATPQQILRSVPFSDAPSRNGAVPNGVELKPHTHRVVVIPAGTPTPHAAELLGSPRLKQFLDQVTSIYDIVILDSSPMLPVADTLELIPHVDGIVICARENKTTRDQAQAVRATLEHFPKRPVGLVVTGTRPHEGDYETYAYTYAYPPR